jgi:phage anti-repressor protein
LLKNLFIKTNSIFLLQNKATMMELEVLISNKGTRVVTATQLFQVLELPVVNYGALVRRWLKDVYAFCDGIRRPLVMKDYAPRKTKEQQVLEDYYLSIEMAKHIALHSRSKVKMKYARRLQELLDEEGGGHPLAKEGLQELISLTKTLCMRSSQEHAEQRHLEAYRSRNSGSSANWWLYRAHAMGYSALSLRQQMSEAGQPSKGKTQRQMLQVLDPYELVRTAVIDHFLALGKNLAYARNMGDLSKSLAREMKLGFFDDRLSGNIFAPEPNLELARQLAAQRQERA